jgi:hypothetical protein
VTVKLKKKICSKCEVVKAASKFYKTWRIRSGLSSACKECQNAQKKKWRAANWDKEYEAHKRYRKKYPEQRLAESKRYREKYREIINEKARLKARVKARAKRAEAKKSRATNK